QWWSMTAYAASGGGDYVVSVTLPHDVFPHVETQVCRYQGGAGIGAWDCGRDTSDFTSVTRRGLRSLSHDWAVGGVVATPTASVTTTPPATRTPTSSPAVTPTPTATPAGTRTPTVAPQRLHLPAILRVRW
ncbi:MAG TPA: hypothetical protein VM537_03265, partial [Anaerolineae bacterium]|nr:hypothetical protein [Anaerolineae bacterium]